jgi:hypothetical protein
MIPSILFLIIAVAIFFWVLAPFFKEFELIAGSDHAEDLEIYIKTNISEFEADHEMGKISDEELKEIETSLKKE